MIGNNGTSGKATVGEKAQQPTTGATTLQADRDSVTNMDKDPNKDKDKNKSASKLVVKPALNKKEKVNDDESKIPESLV